jgi:hypothetical protein
MTNAAPVRVLIELTATSPAPRGTVHTPTGDVAEFEGWLQLLAALRDAIDGDPKPTAAGAPSNGTLSGDR